MITVRKKKHYLNTDRVGYGFVLPALLFMGVFIVFPIVYNFILSFQQVDVMTLMSPHKEWIGFQNYKNVIGSQYLLKSLKNHPDFHGGVYLLPVYHRLCAGHPL